MAGFVPPASMRANVKRSCVASCVAHISERVSVALRPLRRCRLPHLAVDIDPEHLHRRDVRELGGAGGDCRKDVLDCTTGPGTLRTAPDFCTNQNRSSRSRRS